MKLAKHLKNEIEYVAVLALVRIFRFLPRRACIAVARSIAMAFYRLSARHRRNTIRHLTIAFGHEKSDREIRRIAKNMFRHFAAAAVDTIRTPLMLAEGLDRYITVDHIEYLEEAAQKNRGMILLTGHYGNWELLGAWMTWKNYPLRVIGSPLPNPKLNRLLVETRNQAGYLNIERGKELKTLIRTLKEGYPLGILMDQDTRVKGVFADFFGRKANTPVGPIVLARRFNVPVIPGFMHMEKDLTYHIEFFPPLVFSNTGDPEKDLMADIENCNRIYETVILRHPEQWVWMHRRWKRRPELVN